MPERGLARFQFLEALVRVARSRFMDQGNCQDIGSATKRLLAMMQIGKDWLEIRRSVQRLLFTEECDRIYREYTRQLSAVYMVYRTLHSYPGRSGWGITFGGWSELMRDIGAAEVGISAASAAAAFALGKEVRSDEYSSARHMELSWYEFLVCLGAAVRLKAGFIEELFTDALTDFFGDRLCKAQGVIRQKKSEREPSQYDLLLDLASRIFADADDDHSGHLNMREWRRAFGKPHVQQELRKLGIYSDDFVALFYQFDVDNSGEIALQELCQGLVNMRATMQGAERAMAYFRKVFAEVDSEGSGWVDLAKLGRSFKSEEVSQRLAALGLRPGEAESVLEELARNGSGNISVTSDQLINAFVDTRQRAVWESQGIKFIQSIFADGDFDNSGMLDRAQVQAWFCNDRVVQKLQVFHMPVPDWLGIFDALDLDEDKRVLWKQLEQGVIEFWKQGGGQRDGNCEDRDDTTTPQP